MIYQAPQTGISIKEVGSIAYHLNINYMKLKYIYN